MNRTLLSIIVYSISLVGNLYGGSLWKELNVPQASQQFVFIDFADSLDGIIFSRFGTYARTLDGGISWTRDSLSNVGTVSQIAYFGQGRCWILANGNKSALYYTADGKTWVQRILPDSLITYRCAGFATMEKIFLAGIKGIVSSENGGAGWKTNYLIDYPSLGYVSFADSMIGMASFWGFSTSGETNGRVLIRTENAGVKWDTVTTASTVYCPIKFFTPKNGYIIWKNAGLEGMPSFSGVILIGDSAKISRPIWTTDVAYGWIDPLSAIQYDSFPPFILGYNSRLAHDGGNQFSLTLTDPTALKVLAFESVSKNYNWILTEKNRLFQSIGMPTKVNDHTENQPPSPGITLSPNYPNPFNPTTTISFNLPSKSFVTLKIFDVMGRDVATLASEDLTAGRYTRQWNAVAMPTGVYFYRLQAGAFTVTKRLILLR